MTMAMIMTIAIMTCNDNGDAHADDGYDDNGDDRDDDVHAVTFIMAYY